MPRYRISDAARADLDAIWLYVAERGGIDAADRLIDAIMDGIRLLARHPGMGRERDDLATDLRGFPVPDYAHYLIFYRQTDGPIDIVRVLQGSQDLPSLFMH
jgi:toxin ParE1/3/4